MKIVFILPKVSRYPVGGYKMVYEYANRLTCRGHNVSIVYLNEHFMLKYPIPVFIKKFIGDLCVYKKPSWFLLNDKINNYSSLDKRSCSLFSNVDVAVATAVQTVDYVMKKYTCSKVYYIQGLETWSVNEDYLYDTYSLKIHKIIVSQWIKEIVDKYSPLPSVVIRNPIDLAIYQINKELNLRKPHSIAVLYNELSIKGFEYAWKAINVIKEHYPDLTVNMFGRKEFPKKLPPWVKYIMNASQAETVELYNNSKVFICASIEEGYGLTGLEAMACGCVLVSTEYKGVLEYADKSNALLSPIKDVNAMVKNIVSAFEDDDLCKEISKKAQNTIQNYSWKNAVDEFEKILSVAVEAAERMDTIR